MFNLSFSLHLDLSTAPVSFYIPLTVINRYPGAVRLKTNLMSPNDYFKVKPGETLTKLIGPIPDSPVSFTARSVLTNKILLTNKSPVFVVTPLQDKEPYKELYITDAEGLYKDTFATSIVSSHIILICILT